MLVILGVLGAAGAIFAWRMAIKEPEREPRIEVLAGIGGGLITGIAVGVSALFLEQSLGERQKYSAWRANVEIAESIPGFTPGSRDIQGINFSGKVLHNADFRGADLRKAQLRDTDLTGADLRGARMQGANLVGANFYQADLRGAHLEGTWLHAANFTEATINDDATYFTGAIVDIDTCWPTKVDVPKLARHIFNHYEHVRAHWGGLAPDCPLWKNGERMD
ncbi:pentapeptide repeat-containing protein [Streptomyces sp. NPDC002054]|uniref:pentapeptide repeat-containing protein n=1 Tax=Streptomyces sp. NPDC002054 TaxID=3154663 RepID=UPI00331BF04C